MVSFTFDDLPKSAVTTGAGSARGARRARHVLCVGWPGRCHNARMGGRRRQRRAVAASPRPRDRLSYLLAPARLRPRRGVARRRNHAQPRIFPRARSRDRRSRPSPIRSVTVRSRGSSSSRTEFQTCRSIVPGVNAGDVDLQFLRAVPLIDRQMDRDGIDRAFDEAQTNNGWLIFYGHDVAERPSLYGCSPDLLDSCAGGGGTTKYPGTDHGGGVAMRPRLNALFAISVNSPSVSMVNFPCCVVVALAVRRAWRNPKSSPSADACGSSNGSWGRCLTMTSR